MLLMFRLANYLSFKEPAELSLVGTALKDEAADLLQSDAFKEGVLPAAVIYGANASGKSNFFSGLGFLRSEVLYSHSKRGPEDSIPVTPFLLDDESQMEASEFTIDFVFEGERYHYGVELTRERVEREWLYTYGQGQRRSRRVLYHRSIEESPEFYFGPYLKGQNTTISELTRSNSLFLSAAAQNNHQQLTRIRDFFLRQLRFHSVAPMPEPSFLETLLTNSHRKQQVVELLRSADLGVSALEIEESERDESGLLDELRELFERHLSDESFSMPDMSKEMVLLHSCKSGKLKPLPLRLESKGTLALVNLVNPLLEAIEHGQTVIVDELDTSLHPRLSKGLVSMFNRKETNPKSAQILFTTHDTTLLDTDALRRDQIWFAEKNRFGESSLFPLSDFKVRASDNLGKGYLQGRFGAVPRVSNLTTEQ